MATRTGLPLALPARLGAPKMRLWLLVSILLSVSVVRADITFAVSPVQLFKVQERTTNQIKNILTPLKEFKEEDCKTILQVHPHQYKTVPSKSGFVLGAIQAYSRHHNLVIRPDDIWFAIMVQLGFYLNGNAETLRGSLVKHQDQKELIVNGLGSLHSADYGGMAKEMIDKMEEHLVDPSMKEWILPAFSTTTDHDRIAGSVVMMATMKKYFSFTFKLGCGIPNVTLLGTVRDWESIRSRVDHLRQFGGHMDEWVDMLSVVLDQFVTASKGQVDVDFWRGRITAFAVFNEEGTWQGSTKYLKTMFNGEISMGFPIIDMVDIPAGYLTVDVKIDDNGCEAQGTHVCRPHVVPSEGTQYDRANVELGHRVKGRIYDFLPRYLWEGPNPFLKYLPRLKTSLDTRPFVECPAK
ncbi:hypothetical protein AC1031_014162 [Aphanomyces cochlioides]|nr:hypothetical protein AC1031_014162 [Aphanomyces cochlioides]